MKSNRVNQKRILMVKMPLDGHLNPLTGLFKHVPGARYDERWYTGAGYAKKIRQLGIPFYPYQHAREINQLNLDTDFPERFKITGTIKRLRFHLNNVFFSRPDLVSDLQANTRTFPSKF